MLKGRGKPGSPHTALSPLRSRCPHSVHVQGSADALISVLGRHSPREVPPRGVGFPVDTGAGLQVAGGGSSARRPRRAAFVLGDSSWTRRRAGPSWHPSPTEEESQFDRNKKCLRNVGFAFKTQTACPKDRHVTATVVPEPPAGEVPGHRGELWAWSLGLCTAQPLRLDTQPCLQAAAGTLARGRCSSRLGGGRP